MTSRKLPAVKRPRSQARGGVEAEAVAETETEIENIDAGEAVVEAKADVEVEAGAETGVEVQAPAEAGIGIDITSEVDHGAVNESVVADQGADMTDMKSKNLVKPDLPPQRKRMFLQNCHQKNEMQGQCSAGSCPNEYDPGIWKSSSPQSVKYVMFVL